MAMPPSPYDRAVAEFETANNAVTTAKKLAADLIENAEARRDAAQQKLTEMEIAPGLPDPQFHSAFQATKE